jgi:hypothetical protein
VYGGRAGDDLSVHQSLASSRGLWRSCCQSWVSASLSRLQTGSAGGGELWPSSSGVGWLLSCAGNAVSRRRPADVGTRRSASGSAEVPIGRSGAVEGVTSVRMSFRSTTTDW